MLLSLIISVKELLSLKLDNEKIIYH